MRLCPLMLAAAAAFAQDSRPAFSLEKEAALGAELAQEFRRRSKSLDSAAAREYVERVGGQIAAQFPATGITYTFETIIGSTNQLHEPMWFPGGYVFVTAGLFDAAQDQAEFAGMLAHAIAHVNERHGTRQAARGTIANHSSIPLIFMGGWSGSNLVPLGFVKFMRAYELEADLLAAQVMARAGYDPEALVRYVERLQVDPADRAKALSALPLRDSRIASLRKIIAILPPRTYSISDEYPQVREEVRGLMGALRQPPSLKGLPLGK